MLANHTLIWAHCIRAENIVPLVHPEAATAPIHERDIAAIAVAALRGRTEQATSAMLTGPELLTQRRQVELIAQAIGRPVQVHELSEQDGRAQLGRVMPEHMADAVLHFLASARHGGSPVTTTVQQVLGRNPAPFAQWAGEHADDFR